MGEKGRVIKYIVALSQYAQTKEILESVEKSFRKFKEMVWDVKESRAFFFSPGIGKEEKKQLLKEMQEVLQMEMGFFRLLIFLVEENAFNLFGEIYEKFLIKGHDLGKKLIVKIKTRNTLSPQDRDLIMAALKKKMKKELILEDVIGVDSVTGGEIFIVSEGVKLDFSLRTNLYSLGEDRLS